MQKCVHEWVMQVFRWGLSAGVVCKPVYEYMINKYSARYISMGLCEASVHVGLSERGMCASVCVCKDV